MTSGCPGNNDTSPPESGSDAVTGISTGKSDGGKHPTNPNGSSNASNNFLNMTKLRKPQCAA
jgi:hypothetical protein